MANLFLISDTHFSHAACLKFTLSDGVTPLRAFKSVEEMDETMVERWNKVQISSTPGKGIALGGMVAALLGLLGSLFIRPRRVWVRATEADNATAVSLAVLDRSGNGDPAAELSSVREELDTGKQAAAESGRGAHEMDGHR